MNLQSVPIINYKHNELLLRFVSSSQNYVNTSLFEIYTPTEILTVAYFIASIQIGTGLPLGTVKILVKSISV